MNAPRRAWRGGFTLVEMLVVLAIIGILAALIIPAVFRAVVRARENRIIQEVSQLEMAIESYRQQQTDYPPDFTSITQASDLQDAGNIVVKHLRRAFPRHQENLQQVFNDGSGNLLVPDNAEALVSWLSGLTKDPRNPLTSGGTKNIFFPFDSNRLRDPDGNGLMAYYPADGGDAPYVYFDSRTYASARYPFDFDGTTINVYPYRADGDTQPQYMNPTTFQILSAGLDGEFGAENNDKRFPSGRNYSQEDWDNIANFTSGRTLEQSTE